MPIAFRSAASSSTGAGGGVVSFTATAPSGVQEGDLIIAFQGGRSGGTLTPPDGSWTLGRQVNETTRHHFWYWKIAGASEPSTYFWESTVATKWAFVIVAYSGVDTTSPVHVENGHEPGGTDASQRSTPTITTTVDTWLVQGFMHRSTHTALSWGSQDFGSGVGATERGDINTTGTNGTSCAVADSNGVITSGSGKLGRATPSEAASNVAAFIVALKPSASTGLTRQGRLISTHGSFSLRQRESGRV